MKKTSENSEGLTQLPAGVLEAEQALDALDEAFWVGFGRLGAEQLKGVEALQQAFGASALGPRMADAVAGIRRSEFAETHFVTFAAGRTALQGAEHDALLTSAFEALGWTATEASVETNLQATASHHEVYLEAARQWLLELAIVGFFQLTPEVLLPFQATLEKLQGEPKLARQAALLTGFYEEMLAAIPFGSKATVQNRRWPDLWARAMIICTKVPPPAAVSAFTGQIHLVGVEVREHGFYASAVFHGIVLRGAEAIAVRVTLSTWKVDVVFGSELWKLFAARAPTLVKALTDGLVLTVDALPLAETGDMAWDDAKAALAGKLDLDAIGAHLAPGAQTTRRAPPLPLDRHPAFLALPIYMGDFQYKDGQISFGAGTIPLAEAQTPAGDFDVDLLAAASAAVGLLRFNGGWAFQPLALLKRGKSAGKKPLTLAGAAAASAKSKVDAVGILQAKASRLLRRKA